MASKQWHSWYSNCNSYTWTFFIREITFLYPEIWLNYLGLQLHASLDWSLLDRDLESRYGNWYVLFGVPILALWKERNSSIFSNISDTGEALWRSVILRLETIRESSTTPPYIEDGPREIHVDVFKVNVDGSYRRNEASSACGELIRDSCGTFIKGFHFNVGTCNAVWVELWAPFLGIKLDRNLHLACVVFEMDLVHMRCISNRSVPSNPSLRGSTSSQID